MLGNLSVLAQTLVGAIHTRLELISSEIEEQGARIAQIALLCAIAGFCFALAVVLGAVLLVVLFWETHRLAVLAILATLFAAGGAAALASTRSAGAPGEPCRAEERYRGAARRREGNTEVSLERIMLRRGMLRAQVEAERRQITSELAPFAGPLRIAERGWEGVQFLGEHPLVVAAAVAAVGAVRPRRALRWARTGLAAWQAWRWISSTLPGTGPTRH